MGLPTSDIGGMVPPGTVVHSSERRLMLAVLNDAVACYQQYAGAREPGARRMFEDVSNWLDSTDRRSSLCFEKICDSLGMNAARIRRLLHELHERRRPVRS